MSFAALVTDMTSACFAQLGEASTYTAPSEGAVPVACTAMVDEPNEDPFQRAITGAKAKERAITVWLFRSEVAAPISDAVVTQTTTGRSFRLVSLQHRDPDREQWAAREMTP